MLRGGIVEGHVVEESFVVPRGPEAVWCSSVNYTLVTIIVVGVIIPAAVILFMFLSLSSCV